MLKASQSLFIVKPGDAGVACRHASQQDDKAIGELLCVCRGVLCVNPTYCGVVPACVLLYGYVSVSLCWCVDGSGQFARVHVWT